MFRGRYVHTIDAKGRVSLPVELRNELQRRSDRTPTLTNMYDHLALFPDDEWQAYVARLGNTNQFRMEPQELRRFLISGAVDGGPDAQGRIAIPAYLREHAKLEKEVMIAGVGDHIEIWDRGLFEQDLARTRAQFREISTEVSKIGS